MLGHKQIEQLLDSLSAQAQAVTEYRQATVAYQVNLSAEMAAALGTPARRLTPFLATVVEVVANKLEIDDDALKLAKVSDTKAVQRWLGDNNWSVVERELFQCVVRDGKAFILTSWQDEGPKFSVIEAYGGICGAH